jgi:saccharopine dehydrogenase-like NADP-dependent oxidoreductase
MKIIVLGSGKIGSIMAKDFSESNPEAQVTLGDISEERAKKAASQIKDANGTTITTSDHEALTEQLSEYDLILGALPGDYGYKALEAAIEAKVDVVDVSFTPENPTQLDGDAKTAGVTIIPDCGVAPGLSNILTGYSASRLNKVQEAHIMVGGIPEVPVPPLGYTITWSAEGLIDEYVREVTIIENGKKVQVPALSGLEEIDFPGVGKLEAFYTDGLRTLAVSLPEVENMWEKTLRYSGHVEKVRLLRELGFFSDERVTGGEAKGKKTGYRHRIIDRFDHETGVTAMARTTAYTASIVAGMLAEGTIKGPGVIPPEKLGMKKGFTETLMAQLKQRGVLIEETPL